MNDVIEIIKGVVSELVKSIPIIIVRTFSLSYYFERIKEL